MTSLQAALLAPSPASTALGLRGPWSAAATPGTSASGIVPEIAARCGARRSRAALLGHIDAQRAAAELVTVKLLDGLRRRRFFGELDEGESSRAPGVPIGRQIDVLDPPDLRKQVLQFFLRRLEIQVTDKNL